MPTVIDPYIKIYEIELWDTLILTKGLKKCDAKTFVRCFQSGHWQVIFLFTSASSGLAMM